MIDSQESTAIYTEPPMDVTAEMMSPATTALLANMNVSLASATGACQVAVSDASIDNSHNGNNSDKRNHTTSSHRTSNDDTVVGRQRKPLGPIVQNTNNEEVPVVYSRNERRPSGSGSGERIAGPNEANYRQNYDSFVTKSIARYSSRMRTNLRRETLPDFNEMSSEEQSLALASVDQLLHRLTTNGMDDVSAMSGGGREQSSDNSRRGQITTNVSNGQHDNESFDSATTLGEGLHDGTFGSATTLGLGETNEKSKRQSSGSATTLGNNKSLASAITTLGCEEQSISLLEESMILLSDEDEIGGGNDDSNNDTNSHHNNPRTKQDSPGAAAPIERTRHCHNNPHHPTALALEDEMLDTSTPPFSSHKHTSKRCASNSGKRGLKARHRSSHDGEDDSLLLGHFDGHGHGDSGMFLHDQDDVFSCGSPIQRRFSNDGLESPHCDDEMRDRLRDLPDHGDGKKGHSKIVNDNESEGDSRFSHQDENDDVSFNGGNGDYSDDNYDDDNDDGGLEGNWDGTERSRTQDQNQLSQWGTFRTADAKLTISQIEEEDDDEDSPVRRRAIRFDGASQQMAALQSQRQSQRDNFRCSEEEDVEEVAENESSESSIKKGNNADGEDPIQTVRNLCRRAKSLEEQGVDSSTLEEVAPINVRLRDGMHFRMDPLRCRQDKDKKKSSTLNNKSSKSSKKSTKSVSIVYPKGKGNPKSRLASRRQSSDSDNSLSDPEPSFKDPISDFPTRVAARLNAGLSFLTEKEGQLSHSKEEDADDDDDASSAALLSMTIRQIVCVTSKLLIQTIKATRTHQRSKNGSSLSSARKRYTPSTNAPPKDDDYLAGGTLIVLRGKEDIEQWEVALREYTSLSVLNHAGMQSSIRKLANTAGKCAGFDVVLTTYDSMKTKEVTVPVDSSGCAILGGSSRCNDGDGWFTSREPGGTQSGVLSPQKCHQLSVLHRMFWFRVIFMDVLGRKGFLTKPGTARAQAAVAINSKSRFAFFEKEEDTTSKAEAKFKDDRRQLRSIITALHLPERMKLDKLMGTYILDINKAGKASTSDPHSSGGEDNSERETSNDDISVTW